MSKKTISENKQVFEKTSNQNNLLNNDQIYNFILKVVLFGSILIFILATVVTFFLTFNNNLPNIQNNNISIGSNKTVVKPLKGDTNNKVTVYEPCDLAVKYPKIYSPLEGYSSTESALSFSRLIKNGKDSIIDLNISCSLQTRKLFNPVGEAKFEEIKKTDLPLFNQPSKELIKESEKIDNYTLPLKITDKVDIDGKIKENIYYQFLAENSFLYTLWYNSDDDFEIQFDSLNPSTSTDDSYFSSSSFNSSIYSQSSSWYNFPPNYFSSSSFGEICMIPEGCNTIYTNKFFPYLKIIVPYGWKLESEYTKENNQIIFTKDKYSLIFKIINSNNEDFDSNCIYVDQNKTFSTNIEINNHIYKYINNLTGEYFYYKIVNGYDNINNNYTKTFCRNISQYNTLTNVNSINTENYSITAEVIGFSSIEDIKSNLEIVNEIDQIIS